MPSYEGLRLRIQKKSRNVLTRYRLKELHNRDFTILSNNCWGGTIYESYGMLKMTPTVGLFFMAKDYIRFLMELDYYKSKELKFIEYKSSKWIGDKMISKLNITYPIARLDDIELFFMHYHSEREAREKWNRRLIRINKENLIVKFNDQNGCTEEDIEAFVNLPYANKLFFTAKKWKSEENWKQKLDGHFYRIVQPKFYKTIMASYEPIGRNRYLNVTSYLNGLQAHN